MKFDNFLPFGRPQSGTVIIQLMTEVDVSNYEKYTESRNLSVL